MRFMQRYFNRNTYSTSSKYKEEVVVVVVVVVVTNTPHISGVPPLEIQNKMKRSPAGVKSDNAGRRSVVRHCMVSLRHYGNDDTSLKRKHRPGP